MILWYFLLPPFVFIIAVPMPLPYAAPQRAWGRNVIDARGRF